MPIHAQEENLGKRCSVTFQIGPKSWQTSQGRITEFKGSLAPASVPTAAAPSASSKRVFYRQKLALDNGGEVWLDLEEAEKEGRLQWLVHQEVVEDPNDAQPPPNKKRKFDEVTHVLSINSDILKDVLPSIVGFVDPLDRCAMALANSGLRNAVEIHSKNCLATIFRDHAVDDTFEERIRDQTHLETSRTKPVKLPDRYLLAAAKKTRLYTLIEAAAFVPDNENRRIRQEATFCLHPSYRLLAFAEPVSPGRASLQIYDLSTKECIKNLTFQLTNRETEGALDFWGIDYLNNRVVLYTDCVIRVFTETGELVHQVEEWGAGSFHHYCETTTNRHFVMHENGIFSFDSISGAFTLIVRFDDNDDPENIYFEGVCDGRWLVISCEQTVENGTTPLVRFRVYDLKHGTWKDCLKGPYTDFTQCIENPSIFFALPAPPCEEAHVLELDRDGQLIRTSTFSVSNFGSDSSVINNFQRRIYLFHEDSTLQAVSTRDGKIEASLTFPGNRIDTIDLSGSELFVGVEAFPNEDRGLSVAAFLRDQLM